MLFRSKGFCKSAKLEKIEKNGWVLTPGRYVGIPDEEDDGIPFEEKMNVLVKDLKKSMDESKVLDEEIKKSLKEVGFDLERIK